MLKTRRANQGDLVQLSKLFDSYRVFYRKETDVVAAENFLKKRMEKEESVVFVVELADGSLGGFVQLYPIFSSTQMRRLWLLNDLFVDEQFRGRGLSVQLINAAKQLAKETGAVGLMLETEMSNTVGNQLYPRTGFKLNDDHNYYYWDV